MWQNFSLNQLVFLSLSKPMNCPKEAPLMSMWLVQLAWINGWCVMNKYISPYTRWSACVSCLFVLPSSGSAAAMVTQQRVVCSGTLRLESQHWRRTTGKRKGFWRNNRSNQFVRFQLLSFLLFSFWNEHSCSVCHRGGWHASSPPFWRFDCGILNLFPQYEWMWGLRGLWGYRSCGDA